MKKMTFSEFLKDDYAVVRCHTREEFDFLMDKLITRTPYGMYYNPNKGLEGVWYDYGTDSCVQNDGVGSSYQFYSQLDNYTIYDFKDVDFSK